MRSNYHAEYNDNNVFLYEREQKFCGTISASETYINGY